MSEHARSFTPVTPGNGKYCINYKTASSNLVFYGGDGTLQTDKQLFCNQISLCLWDYNYGCSFVQGGLNPYDADYSIWNCAAGCVLAASCTPIPYATFTGPANPITSPSGCPFQCNPNKGLINTGTACVCNTGYYYDTTLSMCSSCINLTPNALWTGPGTSATNCPWQCNAGYYQSGSQCLLIPLYYTTQTPGVGQYCSMYINGFSNGYTNSLDILRGTISNYVPDCGTTGCNIAIDWSDTCSYMGVCQGQGTPACRWSTGPNCGVLSACAYKRGDYGAYNGIGGMEGWLFCNSGCAAVSPCTTVANANFTGPANPATSATGCPYVCNNGYYPNGGQCSPCTGLSPNAVWTGPGTTSTNCPSACKSGYYLSGSTCTVCPLCTVNGYYNKGCSGTSSGICSPCTNV